MHLGGGTGDLIFNTLSLTLGVLNRTWGSSGAQFENYCLSLLHSCFRFPSVEAWEGRETLAYE